MLQGECCYSIRADPHYNLLHWKPIIVAVSLTAIAEKKKEREFFGNFQPPGHVLGEIDISIKTEKANAGNIKSD